MELSEMLTRAREMSPLVPPNAYFLSGNETIRLAVINSASSVVVTMRWRILELTGQVTQNQIDVTPGTSRTLEFRTLAIGHPCWLLNLEIFASSGSPQRGQTFCSARIARGQDQALVAAGVIVAGYVTASCGISYPEGGIRNSLEGPGAIRTITGTDPAAGAEISETVPAGARWRLISILLTLVTDATVATRAPALVLDDGAVTPTRISTSLGGGASATHTFSFNEGTPNYLTTTNGIPIAPIPNNNRIIAGGRIRTITAAMVAGDNYGAPVYTVEEWIEG